MIVKALKKLNAVPATSIYWSHMGYLCGATQMGLTEQRLYLGICLTICKEQAQSSEHWYGDYNLHICHLIRLIFGHLFYCPPPFRRKAEGHSFRHSVLPSVLPSFRPPNIVGTLCAQLLLQFYADSFETLQMF